MVLVFPFLLSVREPIVFFLNLYVALVYGLLYIWFESFPIVFIEIYGFSLGLEGLAFLGILVGTLVGIVILYTYLYFHLEPKFDSEAEEDGGEVKFPRIFLQIWIFVQRFFLSIYINWIPK